MEFCNICKHGVLDMAKHLESADHKRVLNKLVGNGHAQGPHIDRCGPSEAYFPGQLIGKLSRPHRGQP